jgi:hypothetical protein
MVLVPVWLNGVCRGDKLPHYLHLAALVNIDYEDKM